MLGLMYGNLWCLNPAIHSYWTPALFLDYPFSATPNLSGYSVFQELSFNWPRLQAQTHKAKTCLSHLPPPLSWTQVFQMGDVYSRWLSQIPVELGVNFGKIWRDPQNSKLPFFFFFANWLIYKTKNHTKKPRASNLPATAVYQGRQFNLTL